MFKALLAFTCNLSVCHGMSMLLSKSKTKWAFEQNILMGLKPLPRFLSCKAEIILVRTTERDTSV